MSVISQVLHNNIVLIIEPVEEVQTTSIGFWFSVGSRFETPTNRGVTHFVEHMIFKGTSTKSAYQIASSFDRIGGYLNAFTEREDVCAHCVVPAIHTEQAISILCDMSENALFKQSDIDKERIVIESEIISSLDDPEEAALDAVTAAVWPNSSLSTSIAGALDDVRKLDRDTIYSWYEKYFKNGELTVCIAGNVNQTRIQEILEKCCNHQMQNPGSFKFKKLITSEYSDITNPELDLCKVKSIWKNGVTFVPADFQQEQFFVLFPVKYPVDEREYFCHAIINALIGDTMSSRLFQRLRENGGYCYNVYSFYSFYTDTGCWCAYASSSKKNCTRIACELHEELIKILADYVSDEEIEAAKEHLCGEEIISSEDIEYRMKRLSRNYAFDFPFRTTKEITELIRSITTEEIKQGLLNLLDFKNMALVVYGPRLSQKVKQEIIKTI